MSNILVINASGQETRVALIEQGTISEYYLERKNEKGIVGNIYKGRVVRVLPGMQAAFVDIGLEKAAFLYVADIVSDPSFPGFSEEIEIQAGATEGDALDVDDVAEPPTEDVAPAPAAAQEPAPPTPAQDGERAPSVEQVAAGGGSEAATAPALASGSAAAGSALLEQPEQPPPASGASEGAEPGQVPASAAAGAENEDVVELSAEEALEEDDEEDDEEEDLDEGDAAQAAAEAVIAAEEAGAQEPATAAPGEAEAATAAATDGAAQPAVAQASAEGKIGVPAEQRPAARERRGRRRGGRGRRRASPGKPAEDRGGKPGERQQQARDRQGERKGGNGHAHGKRAQIQFLLGLWNEVGKKRETHKAPALMHPDLDLILRSVRDLFSDDVNKLVIDDRAEYERVRDFVGQVAPELKHQVELYTGDEPIFDEYGIEQELQKAQNRKVWLKSGGYIIIDQTEALVAIDVNSGRYVGKKGAGASLEDTITKINCEAAKEIVYQLRLRNIGGIIIIDFIDMDKGANREKVFKTLQDALAADRAKTNVLKISDIGLVEMTRKRVRESVTRLTTETCPTCDGRGHVRSKATMAYEIMREVQRAAGKHREDQLVVSCHPEVAKLLQGPEREALRLLMMKLNKSVTVRPQPQYHMEQYDLHGKWSRPDLQQAQRALSSRGAGGGQRGNGNDRNDRRREDRRQEGEGRPGESAGQAKPEPQPAAEKVGD